MHVDMLIAWAQTRAALHADADDAAILTRIADELRKSVRARFKHGDRVVVLVRPTGHPRKGQEPQRLDAKYIKACPTTGGIWVEIDGQSRRVRRVNVVAPE